MNDRWRRVKRLKMEQFYHERNKRHEGYTETISDRTLMLIKEMADAADKSQSTSMNELGKMLSGQDEVNEEGHSFEIHPVKGKMKRLMAHLKRLFPWGHKHA